MVEPSSVVTWVLIALLHLSGPLESTPVIPQGFAIGDHIRYSEPARYDRDALRQQHRRLRRSAATTSGSGLGPGGLGPGGLGPGGGGGPAAHGPGAGPGPSHNGPDCIAPGDDPDDGVLRINFIAHNRNFRLQMQPDRSVFSDDVLFEGSRGPLHFDTNRVYSGTLEGEEESYVQGIITSDGLFDGTISTPSEHFYVEPVARYLTEPQPFHSIIYRSSDVLPPRMSSCASHQLYLRQSQDHDHSGGDPGASSSGSAPRAESLRAASPSDLLPPPRHHSGMFRDSSLDGLADSEDIGTDVSAHVPTSRLNDSLPPFFPTRNVDFVISTPRRNEDDSSSSSSSAEDALENFRTYRLNKFRKFSFQPLEPTDSNSDSNSVHIAKTPKPAEMNDTVHRIVKNATPQNTNKIVLYNQTILIRPKNSDENSDNGQRTYPIDPEIIRFPRDPDTMANNYLPEDDPRHFHKRATIDPKKTTCMLYLQADHLFFQKYGTEEACIEVMTRHVQRVNAIYKSTDFNQDGKPDNISFMIKRIKVHTLEALHDVTYRFPDNYGVEKFLELFSEEDYDAFCLAYMFTYRDFEMGTLGLAWTGDLKNAGGVCEKNGHYRGSLKSLNTGIVTLLNYGKHVPPAVSHVTLAHEIGHNFGSPHDPEACTPGGEDGNFIMFARATSGDKKNNNHFSPCSLKSINPVLNAKARSSKGCFTEPQTALCGNGVVEPGEECDCGWEEDCRDKCCYPQRRYPPPGEPPCRLTPGSMCSPSQGPCCTSECKLKFGDKCRDDNGCRDSSFCDGHGPHCPPSVNKPNKTICNEEFVCFMGECTGSICLAYGLESCQCIPKADDLPTKACELCCKMPGDGQPCLSSFSWNSVPYDIPDMFSKPGTPCNDYNGYCDVFQKCREVDPSGPLATLRKLLLSEESIASFKRWVIENWYFVGLIVSAVLVLLFLSAKFLAKKPDPKLTQITIIHSSTTETVRLPAAGMDPGAPGAPGPPTIVHPAGRGKLPLKRRVRLDRRRRKDGRKTAPTTTAPSAPPQAAIAAAAAAAPAAAAAVPAALAAANPPQNSAASMDLASVVAALDAVAARNKKKAVKKVTPELLAMDPEQATPKLAGNPAEVPSKERGAAELIPHSPTKSNHKVSPNKKLKTSKAKTKKKEVIDYSSKQSDKDKCSSGGSSPLVLTASDDPMGKVQNWLLHSQQQQKQSAAPIVQESTSEVQAVQIPLPKSKSSPAGLTSPHRSPHKSRPSDAKDKHGRRTTQSVRPDVDKVRLQVLYKGPFKFRFKFNGGATTKLSADRVRKISAKDGACEVKKKIGGVTGPRTAVLVRTREAGEPKKRTKREREGGKVAPLPSIPVVPAALAAAATSPQPLAPNETSTDVQDVDIGSNMHTVPSDLEGLLSETEEPGLVA